MSALALCLLALAATPDLSGEVQLSSVLALARARHPDLAAAEARTRAAAARADAAARLPEPALKYEHWGVPLRRPLALDQAGAVMLGVVQMLPAPGSRSARAQAAGQERVAIAAAAATRARELDAEVRRGFADYYRADRELGLHREHVQLTEHLLELARASYRAGKRSQEDVLRLGLELGRQHRDLAHIERERVAAQARLNALMNRDLAAPLGPPAELVPAAPPPARDDEARVQARAELRGARADVARSEASLIAARREALFPSLTLGADYMYMPLMEARHAYGVMAMVNLPWLSGARQDAVAAAEHALTADRHAAAALDNTLRFEARDARAQLEAARATLAIIDRDLLPLARRTFETAEASYGAGQSDALALIDASRSYLDLRLDRVRALVHLDNAAAEIARTLGAEGSR